MTQQVTVRARDMEALLRLQQDGEDCDLRITVAADVLGRALNERLRYSTMSEEIEELEELVNFTKRAITAPKLARMMMNSMIGNLWLSSLPFFDAMMHSRDVMDVHIAITADWLADCGRFLETHRNNPALMVPAAPAPQRMAERLIDTGYLMTPFQPRDLAPAPDLGRPSRMTLENKIAYYAGADVLVGEIEEFKCSSDEVEEVWQHVYNGLHIDTDDEKRRLRVSVLAYAIHNGCSPNLRTTRRFHVSNDRSVALLDIFKYVAEQSGTFRRFMRGMADEAVAFLMANPIVEPKWGRTHLGRNYDRLLAFDFADGRSDLDPEDARRIRNKLDEILDRQSRSNRRSEFMSSNDGPVQGRVHQTQRSFRRSDSPEARGRIQDRGI